MKMVLFAKFTSKHLCQNHRTSAQVYYDDIYEIFKSTSFEGLLLFATARRRDVSNKHLQLNLSHSRFGVMEAHFPKDLFLMYIPPRVHPFYVTICMT